MQSVPEMWYAAIWHGEKGKEQYRKYGKGKMASREAEKNEGKELVR